MMQLIRLTVAFGFTVNICVHAVASPGSQSASDVVRTPVNGVPGLNDNLNNLRGGPELDAVQIQTLLAAAVPGVDYPILSDIPAQSFSFSCDNVQLAGYYADIDSRCQVFRRCDEVGHETSYLCSNQTVFNQVLLTCDWYYNVICVRSTGFYEWANSHMLEPLPIRHFG